MREVAEREIREVGGHRQITAPTYEAAVLAQLQECGPQVLFDYLPNGCG